MGRLVALGTPRVLFKGLALLLCVVLLVFLHSTEEKSKLVNKVLLELDSSSLEESGSSRDRSMESTQFNPLSSKRTVPKGPDPIHNRRSGEGQKPPGKP